MAPPEKTTYVSSTGQLTAPPLTKRIAEAVSDLAEVGWLFVDTLITVSRVPSRRELTTALPEPELLDAGPHGH